MFAGGRAPSLPRAQVGGDPEQRGPGTSLPLLLHTPSWGQVSGCCVRVQASRTPPNPLTRHVRGQHLACGPGCHRC